MEDVYSYFPKSSLPTEYLPDDSKDGAGLMKDIMS